MNVHHVLVFAVTSTTNLQLAKTLINIVKEAKKEANYMSERHPEEANHRLEQTKSPLSSSKRQHKEKKNSNDPWKKKTQKTTQKRKKLKLTSKKTLKLPKKTQQMLELNKPKRKPKTHV